MDPYIDGVVPTPLTPEEKGFALGMLIGNLRRIHAAYDDEGEDLSALPAKAADEIEKLLDRLTKDGNAYWEAREHLINRIELLAKRNEALGSYRADEYEEAMQELDRHGIPRADGPSDNGLTLSLKGRMLRFLVRMTSNALAQADAACGVSPGAMGSAADYGGQEMQTYTAKLKTRKQMERDIPSDRLGWWHDVCPGETLRNLRDATDADIARCFLREGTSKNPADYLCENFDGGCLVSHEAVAKLTINQ